MNDQSSSTVSSTKPLKKQSLSSTGASSPVLVPTPTLLEEPESDPEDNVAIMEESGETNKAAALNGKKEIPQPTPPAPTTAKEAGDKDVKASLAGKQAKWKAEKERRGKKNVKKSKKREESAEEQSSSEDSSSDDESSEDEKERRRKKKKKAMAKAAERKKAAAKLKAKKKGKKSKKYDSSDASDSSSDSDSDSGTVSSENETSKGKRKAKAKAKGNKKLSKKYDSSTSDSSTSLSSSSDSDSSENDKAAKRKLRKKKAKKAMQAKVAESSSASDTQEEATNETTATATDDINVQLAALQLQNRQLAAAATAAATVQTQTDAAATTAAAATDKKTAKKGKKNALDFKRVDQVWDSKIRDYKFTESVEEQKDDCDSVFTVRRRFGWDNKYLETQVDIKSKLLRNVLQVVFKDCKSISLVEDKPSIQPNMLYHYYTEIKAYIKKTLQPQLKRTKKRKDIRPLTQQIAQCKLLLRYIDEDYADTRATLKSMLKAGTITYNLVWALFKPNTIAYTPTYGNKDDPRAFKVDHCYEEEDWFGNKKWNIEGRYLEYDGKVFGLGDYFAQIAAFKGPRKIANLGVYPLSFHKEEEKLREELIERGKKFVALQGMNYRFLKGLAYMKVKRVVMKFNINGRVMIDPALFRRMNANYPLSYIKADELGQDSDSDSDDDEDDGGCCGDHSDSDADAEDDDQTLPKGRVVMWKDKSGKKYLIRLSPSDKGPDITAQKLDTVAEADVDSESDTIKHVFSEEELLIASPVVLGFSFSEKAWVEFSLAGIKEIEWNDEAFSTLVLPTQVKQNLKGLVSSHRFDAAKTIDDVIVGKGKGLNVVLHGPPGVGKTLTGESIAEYLRCPLYSVSSGELGTNASQLERDLNRIMDITHSWGAILLLDEADVFLEARQAHDIHRNALVSVFLRLTEYYQGILFLTTNRVSTFDEAFQSRIHMGIRYENLTMKARMKVWQHHVGKVEAMCEKPSGDHKTNKFEEDDYEELSKKVMNGRQIKNAVKTSQAIAIAEKGVFSMDYVKRVMDAHEAFEEDMKGGRGYRDAMRQYT